MSAKVVKDGDDKRNKQARTADLRRVLHASRKREGEALDALHIAVNANVVVKHSKKDRGTTLGNTAAAQALRAQMIEVVRENASGGQEAAVAAAVAAGFFEKEVAAYVRFAPVTDGIVFGGEEDEPSQKKDESSSSSSSD